MTFWKLVLAGVRYHARTHFAVALGVAAATAIVVGALEIGASMRGSLADLTVERLGDVEEALVATGWFREELASELARTDVVENEYAGALPVIWFPQTTVERQGGDANASTGDVALWGVPDEFWDWGVGDGRVGEVRPRTIPGQDEIVLNDVAARRLGLLGENEAATPDRPLPEGNDALVLLRVPDELGVPEEAALGRKDSRAISIARLRVVDILPSEGLGRFGLFPSQIPGPVAFVGADFLRKELDREGQANVLLVAGKQPRSYVSPDTSAALQAALDPRLTDLGFTLSHERLTYPPEEASDGSDDASDATASEDTPEVIYDYWSLTSEKLLIPPDAEEALSEEMARLDALPTLTYLANFLEVERDRTEPAGAADGGAEETAADDASEDEEPDEPPGIPYSLVAGIELGEGFPLKDLAGEPIGPLGEDEIVLNSAAAGELNASTGDRVRLYYFLPESIEGKNEETSRLFTVKAITPITVPPRGWLRDRPPVYDEPPTIANDERLTPETPGLTDRDSIDEWDPPFEMTRQTGPADDVYWKNHRTAPRSFVAPETARELWGSRFGEVSSYRIPAASVDDPAALSARLARAVQTDAPLSRLAFRPVKREGLAASTGSTPFDVLFLMLSMFILGSALALVLMLFRLGLEMRSTEIGLLAAVGWTRRKIGLAFLCEGAIVAAIGAAVGIVIGVGYAQLMILALTTWWIGAISTTNLTFHFDAVSLVAGFAAGLLASCATIAWATFRTRGSSVRALLRGNRDEAARRGERSLAGRLALPLGVAAILGGVGLAGFAVTLGGMAQAGAFLGGGALMLTGGLAIAWGALRAGATGPAGGTFGWNRFVFENARRNPGRSVLTISSVAIAAFLVIGVSAFQMAPTVQGTGGFDYLATVDRPVYENPMTPAGRKALFPRDEAALAGVELLPLRYRLGDDASCSNLYQTTRPQAWGVPAAVVRRLGERVADGGAGFAFGAVEPGFEANPWEALERDYPEGVPVILDRNTAMYSLKLYGGIGETFEVDYGSGQVVTFRVTGLLADTILQGGVLLSEKDFIATFPESPGYRTFLVDASNGVTPGGEMKGRKTPADPKVAVAKALHSELAGDGLVLADADERLARFLSVQNTYLQTFQSLGALGLLLGAFGVAAAQMRNVFERRRELALLRAVGFSRGRVGSAVLTENLALLAVGFALGGVAAAAASLPQVFLRGLEAPWLAIGFLAVTIVGVGAITSWLATRFLFRLPLLTALRGE